jgi:hypothetical protein
MEIFHKYLPWQVYILSADSTTSPQATRLAAYIVGEV